MSYKYWTLNEAIPYDEFKLLEEDVINSAIANYPLQVVILDTQSQYLRFIMDTLWTTYRYSYLFYQAYPDPKNKDLLRGWFIEELSKVIDNNNKVIYNSIVKYGENPVKISVEKYVRKFDKSLSDTGTSSNSRDYNSSSSANISSSYNTSSDDTNTSNHNSTSQHRENVLPQQTNPEQFTGFDYMNSFNEDKVKGDDTQISEGKSQGTGNESNKGTSSTKGTENFTRDYLKRDDTNETKDKTTTVDSDTYMEVAKNISKFLGNMRSLFLSSYSRKWVKCPPNVDILEN